MECPPLLKIELHAHFEVNVTPQILHDIWIRKQQAGRKTSPTDPLDLTREEKYTDSNTEELISMISSFLGDLLTDKESIQYALRKVLVDFFSDNVVYLELRVRPRQTRDLSAEEYIQIFLDTIKDFEIHFPAMHTQLLLCVNRSHSLAAAKSVVSLATRLRTDEGPGVVGIDFCGDPTVRIDGEISMFTPAFEQAAENGLGITVSFAETIATGSRRELDTLLSWNPGRVAHVIWEDEEAKQEIIKRGLCVELCLSYHVRTGMTSGGFPGHHFKEWAETEGPKIALVTGDAGVFGIPPSTEYRLVAQHFNFTSDQMRHLARQGIEAIFGDEKEKQRLRKALFK
ncbi:hypothetical protein E4U27_000542 [Claviceps purpurea]|nr:hypothetical protein E4U27_000542 [Claviceps purpurea]